MLVMLGRKAQLSVHARARNRYFQTAIFALPVFLTSYTEGKQKCNIICAVVPKEYFTAASFVNLKQQLLGFAPVSVLPSIHWSQKMGSSALSSVQHYSRNRAYNDLSTSFLGLFPRRLQEKPWEWGWPLWLCRWTTHLYIKLVDTHMTW